MNFGGRRELILLSVPKPCRYLYVAWFVRAAIEFTLEPLYMRRNPLHSISPPRITVPSGSGLGYALEIASVQTAKLEIN